MSNNSKIQLQVAKINLVRERLITPAGFFVQISRHLNSVEAGIIADAMCNFNR